MYQVYADHMAVVSTADASAAVAVYWQQVEAGARPAIWRDGDVIVHITSCEDCRAPVLMTRHDVAAYVSAFG